MEQMIGGAATPAGDVIKDTSDAAFAADVIDASSTVPVIVDFWAPWCGPCRQLGPALEKAVTAARGKARLVKINIDENPQVASQLRIQSIPAVYAFFQGRPVDGFVGALPESQIKAFVDKLTKLAGEGADPLEEILEHAKQALEAEDFQTAGSIYSQILQEVPDIPAAIAGLARALIGLGQVDQARAVLDGAGGEAAKAQEVISARSLLELSESAGSGGSDVRNLRDAVAANPDDHQARVDLAMALYAQGDRQGAADALLESIRLDREWNENEARKQLLKLFEAFGPTDPVTVSSRRKLSSMLFS